VESLFDNIRTYIRTVPKNRLYLYVMLLLAGIGVAVIGLSFIEREEYQPLFAGLTTEDASTVVARLKEQKIPYKLGANGTTVSVPKERASEVRLLLASANAMPGGGGVGLELFDRTSYGMTEFMQTVNYKRAIQGELTRTINQMPEVKACRIHIAMPEKTLFTEKEQEVTASVFLKLKPGRELSREQVAGVVQLVAGSIEGLKPDSVVVVDSSGKVLHKSGEGGSGLVVSGQQYELQKSVEKKIEESVQSMLQTVLMNSRSIVRASVDLNLRKVEKVEEEYAPDKKVVTQEKKSRERSVNSKPKAGGVTGAAANLAAAASKTQKHGANPKHEEPSNVSEMEREDVQTGYEVSKSVRKIVEPFGDVKRMSLAVLVDGKYEKTPGKSGEELKYIPRSQQELNNIRNVAARAAGLNEERGDKIEVINMPFEVENVPEEKTFLKPENKELALNFGKYAFYLVIALCVFFFVLRPLFGIVKKKGDVHPLQAVKDIYVKGGAPAAAIPAAEKPQPALMEALNDKALVGSIIREWVKENP
jgi:flagellar M-ring protein FliF